MDRSGPGRAPECRKRHDRRRAAREIARGREEAVGMLYARYAPTVFGIAAPSLDAATAEEIVQDVFVAVWHAARIVRPGARERARLVAADRPLPDRQRAAPPQPPAAYGVGRRRRRALARARPGAGPVGRVWRDRRGEILRRALRELPPPDSAALGLAFFEDLSHREIAALLGIPLGTAKSRIRSGVARLRTAPRAARRRARRRHPRRPARLRLVRAAGSSAGTSARWRC